MKGWYFIIDAEKCENCHNCFLACKDEHVNNDWTPITKPMAKKGRSWIEIKGRERGQYPFIDVCYLPVPCMHCDNAPCIRVAKNGAVYKRKDGIVIIDPSLSKEQKELVEACPYNAITWNEELKIPQKCTFCAHLLDEGWKTTRCVQACPTGALSIYYAEEAEIKEKAQTEGLQNYKANLNSKPRVFYKNLHLFTKNFLGGSLFTIRGGIEECLEADA
ncbi:MAG: oxidoreductase [Deltaproteobacteria bacterium]|nr:oxidoreductase [Deltaproteobacteria bacterium]